jgi:two-component system phosphate regulon sensor histidine kinase PhoR
VQRVLKVRPAYRYEAIRFTAVVSLGVLLGLLTEEYVVWLSATIAFYLAEHFYQLVKLVILTDSNLRVKPPFPGGLWGEIYQAIAHHQTRSRKRKRGLVRFATRFREAAGAIPDALVILDKDQKVEWANPSTHSLLGFSWPDSAGKPIIELISYPALYEYIDGGEYNQPVDFVPSHNKAIVLSIRVTPFGGKKHQRLLVARDITKIYHLNQIRRDFVANVSHELRTPLTVINGFVENLLDAENSPASFARPLKLMHSQAARMESIIQDLLTLSRIEMVEKASDQSPIDVPEMLEDIIAEAQVLSNAHSIKLDMDENLWLLGNQSEIRSAFSNLVFNAIKHSPAETTVEITWLQDDQGCTFTVTDYGDGIESKHIPRLTERFYRVDKARSRESGGTGLGLAIVKHALHRHEAELHISSKPDYGSTFSCRFPSDLALDREQFASTIKDTPATPTDLFQNWQDKQDAAGQG